MWPCGVDIGLLAASMSSGYVTAGPLVQSVKSSTHDDSRSRVMSMGQCALLINYRARHLRGSNKSL